MPPGQLVLYTDDEAQTFYINERQISSEALNAEGDRVEITVKVMMVGTNAENPMQAISLCEFPKSWRKDKKTKKFSLGKQEKAKLFRELKQLGYAGMVNIRTDPKPSDTCVYIVPIKHKEGSTAKDLLSAEEKERITTLRDDFNHEMDEMDFGVLSRRNINMDPRQPAAQPPANLRHPPPSTTTSASPPAAANMPQPHCPTSPPPPPAGSLLSPAVQASIQPPVASQLPPLDASMVRTPAGAKMTPPVTTKLTPPGQKPHQSQVAMATSNSAVPQPTQDVSASPAASSQQLHVAAQAPLPTSVEADPPIAAQNRIHAMMSAMSQYMQHASASRHAFFSLKRRQQELEAETKKLRLEIQCINEELQSCGLIQKKEDLEKQVRDLDIEYVSVLQARLAEMDKEEHPGKSMVGSLRCPLSCFLKKG
eukprot:353890-Chlamydomonas_euryale.AAC.2